MNKKKIFVILLIGFSIVYSIENKRENKVAKSIEKNFTEGFDTFTSSKDDWFYNANEKRGRGIRKGKI